MKTQQLREGTPDRNTVAATRVVEADPRNQALFALRSIFAAVRRHMVRVQRLTGFGAAQIWAVSEVEQQPGMRVGDLAVRLRVHPSTASNLVRDLRSAGLISSKQSPLDARALCLYSTARGRELVKKAPAPQRGVLAEGLARLTGVEGRRLAAALVPLERELAAFLRVTDGDLPIAVDRTARH